MKKIAILPLATLIMFAVVFGLTVSNERMQTNEYASKLEEKGIRDLVGLPSIAIGTGYGATRNPLLEIYCTSLYDLPGGYCYIISASLIDTPMKDPEYFASVPGFNITAYKK